MRECCEELFLTFLYSFKSMSSRGETLNKEGGEESSFMLQAMQQQFEHMNVVFNEIRDQMDRQDAVIATLREKLPQRVPNARKQERRVHVDDSDDDHNYSEEKKVKLSVSLLTMLLYGGINL